MDQCSLDSVENISEACNDAFFAVGVPQNKIQFNPLDPLGSLTQGSQQFTIIADTEHGTPAASHLAVSSVLTMADSGVKHIMLEMHPDPDLQGLLDKLYHNPAQISDEEFLNNAYLFNAEGDDIEKVVEDGNNYAIMILEASKLGIQVHLVNDQAGYSESEQLIKIEAQQQALRDENPTFDQYMALNDSSFKLYEQREAVLAENFEVQMAVNMAEDMGLSALPQSVYDQFSPEALEVMKRVDEIDVKGWELYEKMEILKQRNPEIIDLELQNDDLVKEWLNVGEVQLDSRLSLESEEARADKFIDLANGEKAVVIFGSGHTDKLYDLNEAIDEKLKQEALQNGSFEHFVETQVIATYDSREDYRDKANIRGEQSPDVIYFADQDKAYITVTGRDNLELGGTVIQVPTQQMDQSLGM